VLVLACVAAVAAGLSLSRGTFETPAHPISKESFSTERLNAFRGGFDRVGSPTNAKRPQAGYDNTLYAAPNYYQHELIYLEDGLVLDWQASTGEFRVFELARHPDSMCPAIPERPIVSGTWSNRKYHKLVYIGCAGSPPGGKILDYDPMEGTYEIVRFNHKPVAGQDPMMDVLSSGFRREIMNFEPIYVNDDEIFFYEIQTGKFSAYYLNNQLPSKIDPIQPSEPIAFGMLQGLHQQILYVGHDTVLDYDQQFGRFWLYHYDRTVVNNTSPLKGPLASGVMEKGMALTYVAEDQIAMLDPETGMFGLFDLVRPPKFDYYEDSLKTEEQRQQERAEKLLNHDDNYAIKHEPGNYGYGTLVAGNQCTAVSRCRDCLSVPGCGWCSTNKVCLRGSTSNPCGTNCTTWMPVFCEAEPCSTHKGCSDCLLDPFCGWCAESAMCTEGVNSGPLFGSCESWSKVSCPFLFAESSSNSAPPCVDSGLISL